MPKQALNPSSIFSSIYDFIFFIFFLSNQHNKVIIKFNILYICYGCLQHHINPVVIFSNQRKKKMCHDDKMITFEKHKTETQILINLIIKS